MAETSEMVERVRNAIDAAWMDWALGEGRQENRGDVPVELLAVAAIAAHSAALAETDIAKFRAEVRERQRSIRMGARRGPKTSKL